MGLNFDLKKNGFPVSIAGVDFFFETSTEKLQEFFLRQEEFANKRTQVEKQATALVKSTDLDENDPNYVHEIKKELDRTLDFTKQLAVIDYDSLFGDGAFDKIYAACPDIDQLAKVFDDIADAIADEIIRDTSERTDKYNAKKAEMLKKKSQKRKK